MDPERKICYCYHVSLGKLMNFARRTAPVRPSQLSECLGAGTGCGWCIPFLKQIHAAARSQSEPEIPISPHDYESRRKNYITTKHPRNEF